MKNHAAEYMQNRDGIPNDVYFCSASQAIKCVMKLLVNRQINGKVPGIIVPETKFPVHPSTVMKFGMKQINYHLDEEANWGINKARRSF